MTTASTDDVRSLVRSARARMMRLAIAIATLLVATGFATPARACDGPALAFSAAFDVVVVARTDASVAALPSHHHWQDSDSQGPEDDNVVESDLDDDDDDDPLCHVPSHAVLAFRELPAPGRPSGASRRALSIDTSRFATGTGCPRGPPV